MSRKGLIPKKITDKNGKETTVYVKTNEAMENREEAIAEWFGDVVNNSETEGSSYE